MPMSSEPFMPEGLEDFPWKHLLHMWAYDSWALGTGALKLKLWLTPSTYVGMTLQEYHVEAMMTHHQIWDWLAERYVIADIPELEMEGNAWWNDRAEPPQQVYERLACWGTYYLARKHEA
jgi:hypothetical protein